MTISSALYSIRNRTMVLPALSHEQQSDRDRIWTSISNEFRKPMAEMNYTNIRFPLSAIHAYDEKEGEVCSVWNKTAGTINRNAKQGLRQVLLLAVNLMAVGCEPNRAFQLVRHYCAHISLGIRCLKVEGSDLLVPDTFMLDYRAASLRMMSLAAKENTLRPAVDIPSDVFEKFFSFVYEKLSSYGGWGQADSLFSSDFVVKNMLSYIVRTINLQIIPSIESGSSTSLATAVRQGSQNSGPDCYSSNNSFNEMKCTTNEKFCYFELKNIKLKSWTQNCCQKLICENSVRISPTTETYESCCFQCNQFGCTPSLEKNSELSVPSVYHKIALVIHIYLL